MSSHRYINDSKNLFIDDDVDDETFLRNSRQPPQTNYYNNTSPSDPMRRLEQQKQSFIEQKREIEERTINSTQRSLGLLRDSEQVGIATAEELQRQREQLERTDKRLDEINSTLRYSQKHLNGIKSVFGSLKNYISGRNDSANNSQGSNKIPSTSMPTSTSMNENKLGDYATKDSYNSHPLTRIRSEDEAPRLGATSRGGPRDAQAVIDANLEEMCDSIVKLKGLAVDLSSEIDSQNDLIDNITYKTDKADLTINTQNKLMNKILKK